MLALLLCTSVYGAQGGGASEKPLTKVIRLLQDMKRDLEKEFKSDQETFEALTCWCETNDKGKTKAIEDARQKIDDLESTIQGSAARKAELNVEIEDLKKDVIENKKALAEAIAIREKEAAEFHDQEKELLANVILLR